MTRGQRTAHRWLWQVLAPLLLGLVAFAVFTRADAPVDHGPTMPRTGPGR